MSRHVRRIQLASIAARQRREERRHAFPPFTNDPEAENAVAFAIIDQWHRWAGPGDWVPFSFRYSVARQVVAWFQDYRSGAHNDTHEAEEATGGPGAPMRATKTSDGSTDASDAVSGAQRAENQSSDERESK